MLVFKRGQSLLERKNKIFLIGTSEANGHIYKIKLPCLTDELNPTGGVEVLLVGAAQNRDNLSKFNFFEKKSSTDLKMGSLYYFACFFSPDDKSVKISSKHKRRGIKSFSNCFVLL